MEFLAKRTDKQRNALPKIATQKFAASKSYDFLRHRQKGGESYLSILVHESAGINGGLGPMKRCSQM